MDLFTPDDPRPIHFMGIAGAGMGALALMARRRGVAVTGCDLEISTATDVIEAGAEVWSGHDPGHAANARAVVHTSAVPREHAELEAARAAGLPVVRRAEALGSAVARGTVLGVAGTHGKTTTTVMAADILAAAGRRPTALAGGRVAGWGGNARLDGDDVFVVEADEYDRSFLALTPTVAIVTNIEADHLECYGTVEALEDAFTEFAQRAEHVVIGADDAGAVRVASRLTNRVWRVGTGASAEVQMAGIRSAVDVTEATLAFPDGDVTIRVGVPGAHNLRNGAMAVAAAWAMGIDPVEAVAPLASFAGVGRRFEAVGTRGGVEVVDDYAHHPTEIAATLQAARQRYPAGRIIAVFQPHLYSRTERHAVAMGQALIAADLIVVTDVYPAREPARPGVTGRLVADAAEAAGGHVDYVSHRADLPAHLADRVETGDVVLTLGAGDVTLVGPELLRRLDHRAA